MRKALLMVSSITLALLFSSTVFAAAWNVPTNVRMVQKSNTDTTGRIYGTIQAAINSITNASATNPYVVRVLPGIYAERITMKPYVDIVGSGQNDTIISSATTGDALTTDDKVTVENITITSSVLNNFPYNIVKIKENTSSTFRNVTLKLPTNANYQDVLMCAGGSRLAFANSKIVSDGTAAYIGIGIELISSSLDMQYSSITLNTNNENIPVALYNDSGDVSIKNSEISMTTLNGIEGIETGTGNFKMVNSIIKTHSLNGDGGDGTYNVAVAVNAQNFDMLNSQSIATSANAAQSRGVIIRESATINASIKNSVVSGTSLGIRNDGGGSAFKIGNSQIIGGHNGVSGTDKVVNCFDENFNPIPNI